MSQQGWNSLPYLDALRPEPGWRTGFAVLGSYSVDLIAFVAALLALAGLDDERGSGSRVDFANTIELLRDRVRILVQSGRIGAPARTPKILAILDRFVREVPMDEAAGSWHPKVALVRLEAEDGVAGAQWRLWLGSRNLTRDTSWDVGLALVGSGDGRPVPGIAELGRELAARSALPGVSGSRVFAELNDVRWQMPSGCTVEEVRLLLGSARPLPHPPREIRKLTVVSPFLDGSIVGEFGRWGDARTRRVLLSSQGELSKLASQAGHPLEGYADLLYLDSPAQDLDDSGPADDGASTTSEDEEPEQRGLHAKLVYAEHAGGRSLWLGSANATQRGWKGPNAEIVARLSVTAKVGAGIDAFVREIGRLVALEALPSHEKDELKERLEEARRQVAARWAVVQRVGDGVPVLEAQREPHPDDPSIELAVGLLGQPMTGWPRATRLLRLPSNPVADLTELVRCELRAGDGHIAWIQRTPMDPPPGEERDRRAFSRYLDPRTFLLWIRSLLTGDPLGGGGGDWDGSSRRPSQGARVGGPAWWVPTIEDALKAWTRDPSTLANVDRKVRHYLEIIDEERREDCSDAERNALAEFRSTWDVLRLELMPGRS